MVYFRQTKIIIKIKQKKKERNISSQESDKTNMNYKNTF